MPQVLWISAGPDASYGWADWQDLWNVESRPAEEAIDALAVTNYSAIVLELPYAGWSSAELLEAVTRVLPVFPFWLETQASPWTTPSIWRT